MIGLAKSYIYFAEKAAYEDAIEAGFKSDIPDPNAPITLDRLWEVCKKYLWGTNSLYKKSSGDTYIFINNSDSENNDDGRATLLLILIAMWIVSGIAFQRGLKSGVEYITDFGKKIAGPPFGFLGATAGVIISAVVGLFLKPIYGRTYFSYLQTGMEIGYEQGSTFGKWVGFLATIIPGAIIGGTLGIIAGLPIGALTLIVGALQGIKTIGNAINSGLNYISEKFQEIQRRNNVVPQIKEETKNIMLNDDNLCDKTSVMTPDTHPIDDVEERDHEDRSNKPKPKPKF